jgi:hypothetical protein
VAGFELRMLLQEAKSVSGKSPCRSPRFLFEELERRRKKLSHGTRSLCSLCRAGRVAVDDDVIVARRASRLHSESRFTRPPPALRSGPPGRRAGRAADNSSLFYRPQGGSSKNCSEEEATSGPVLAALIFYFVSRFARLVPFVSRQKGQYHSEQEAGRVQAGGRHTYSPSPETESRIHEQECCSVGLHKCQRSLLTTPSLDLRTS